MGRSVLILGVGNPLAGDDGVGVRAIEGLATVSDLPEGIRLLDVGVLGMDILAWTAPDFWVCRADFPCSLYCPSRGGFWRLMPRRWKDPDTKGEGVG